MVIFLLFVQSSQEDSNANLSDEEKSRLAELQRRNTLCLPHLKSSYPMELTVSKKDEDVGDAELNTVNSGKRKLVPDDAPRGTFKKCKTDSALRSSDNLAQLGWRSDSNLRRSSRLSPTKPEKPTPQSVAFEITMEPAKNTKQRMPRSQGSGNLVTSDVSHGTHMEPAQNTKQRMPRSQGSGNLVTSDVSRATRTRTAVKDNEMPNSLKNNITQNTRTKSLKNAQTSVSRSTRSSSTDYKGPSASFSRGEAKRSSFSRATHKVAASFRGKKITKK